MKRKRKKIRVFLSLPLVSPAVANQKVHLQMIRERKKRKKSRRKTKNQRNKPLRRNLLLQLTFPTISAQFLQLFQGLKT